MLYRPEKFHHHCLAKEVYITNDHRPLIAEISTDVATLSQQLQSAMLPIHQYRVHIIYKPGPDLYVEDWLS